MKKIKLGLVAAFLLFFSNCKTSNQATYERRFKEAYLYDFKITYFKRLLLEGFNQSDEIKTVLNKDASKGLADTPLGEQEYELIDSFTKIDNGKMVKDSINSFKRAEGAQGKYIFSYAIDKFNSKWLDSLAKARYKIFFKTLNAD